MKNPRPVRLTAAVSFVLLAIGVGVAVGLVLGFDGAWSAETVKTRSTAIGSLISVKLPESARKRAGIVTAPLAHAYHEREIQAYGMVLPVQGLAGLGSSYARARAQVENAKTRRRVSQFEYARLKALYSHNQGSSLKDLQVAESVRDQDRVNVQTARAEQRALADSALQQWGAVISSWVFKGAPYYLKLMDREEMLVQVTLPPGDKISPMPREVTIQPPGQSRLKAYFVSSSPRTDPRIQGMSYFYMLPSRPGHVQAGMNAAVFLPEGPRVGGFLVPLSAVVWQNGEPFVFVQKGQEEYLARPVATNFPLSGGYLVTHGFTSADRVVVEGAQTLLSQALLSGAGAAGGGD